MVYKNTFRLEISPGAKRDISRLDFLVQKWLLKRLDRLEKSSDPMHGSAKLVGEKNIYRHRFGDYRIIFALNPKGQIIILFILKVAHRKDVYDF